MALGPFSKHRRIEREFARRAPWITRFTIDGRGYGGDVAFDDSRLTQFEQMFSSARSILDLGSLEGGQTFLLANRPGRRVLAVEGRPANIARAQYVQQLLRADNVRFVEANLERVPIASFGIFDAVFCSGLLYHLPRPWELLDQFRGTSSRLFLSTHHQLPARAGDVHQGQPGQWQGEGGLPDRLSGLSPRSFWLTLDAITDRLRAGGFNHVRVMLNDSDHPNGPITNIAAWADEGVSPSPTARGDLTHADQQIFWDPALNGGSGAYQISGYREPAVLAVWQGFCAFSYLDTTITIAT